MGSISSLLHTIILLGALQGIIIGCLLYYVKQPPRSNRFLAIALWLIALASLNIYLNYTGWYYINTTTAIIHALVPMVLIMPLGPLVYFYIRSSVDPGFSITPKQRIHFLPLLIDILPSLIVLIYLGGTATALIHPDPGAWGAFIDQYNVYSDIPRWISLTCYTVLSARHLSGLKRKTNNQTRQFKWLQQFVRIFFFFQAIWLLYLIPYVIPAYTDKVLQTVSWVPVYLPLAIMIYWLGIKGYIAYLQNINSKKRTAADPSLAIDIVKKTISGLKRSMEQDHLYLNQALTIATLARHTGIRQKTISAVLNQHLKKSFAEFVNEYRIEAVKKKLAQPDMGLLTITGIALECGFNSKSSFQRIFKEITGASPLSFRKSLAENDQ